MPYRVAYRPSSARPGEPWVKIALRTGKIASRQAYYATQNMQLIFNANPLRADPTRTVMLRQRFMEEMRRRFAKLRKAVYDFLVTKDALGLQAQQSHVTFVKLDDTIQPRQYQFQTDAQKLTSFNDWFKQQVEQNIFAPKAGTPAGTPWTTTYVESAYKRGLINSYLSSKQAQLDLPLGGNEMTQEEFLRSAFNQPEAMSKVQLLGTRAWEGMKGITSTMGSQLNQVLSAGIIDGSGAVEIAKDMTDKIAGLTNSRAMLIARTEIIHAHAEGQLDAFERLGIQELGIRAEWSTAGDDRVCEECAAMEGQVFSVEEAHGLIPLHPNCRCAWIPAEKDVQTEADQQAAGQAAAGDLSVEAIQEADALASTLSRPELEAQLKAARAAFNTAKKAGITGEELKALEREVWRSNRALWKFKQGIAPVPAPVGPTVPAPTPAPTIPAPPAPAPPAIIAKPTPVPGVSPPTPPLVKVGPKFATAEEYRAEVLKSTKLPKSSPQLAVLEIQKDEARLVLDKLCAHKNVNTVFGSAEAAAANVEIDKAYAEWSRVKDIWSAEKNRLLLAREEAAWNTLVEPDSLASKVNYSAVAVPLKYQEPMKDVLSLMPAGVFTPQQIEDIGNLRLFTVSKTAMNGDLGTYNDALRLIKMPKGVPVKMDTVAHEFAHHISYQVRDIYEAQQAFFEARTAGEEIVQLEGYSAKVQGKKDLFGKTRVYAGRVYKDGHSPEVISVGVQMLYDDPVNFALKDPEYFNAIVKMLKGL